MGDRESFQVRQMERVCFVLNGRSQKREKGLKIHGREEGEEMASRTQAGGGWRSPPLKKGSVAGEEVSRTCIW